MGEKGDAGSPKGPPPYEDELTVTRKRPWPHPWPGGPGAHRAADPHEDDDAPTHGDGHEAATEWAPTPALSSRDESAWLVRDPASGTQVGPVTLDQVRRGLGCGKLAPHVEISHVGGGEWVLACRALEEMERRRATALGPPPLPRPPPARPAARAEQSPAGPRLAARQAPLSAATEPAVPAFVVAPEATPATASAGPALPGAPPASPPGALGPAEAPAPSVPSFELAPGTLVGGDLRVLGVLGEGGMGVVYEAEQLSTGRRRALKVMHPHLVRDPALRQRFAQEARIGATIASDHVVDVVAAGVEPSGLAWLAMELLVGEHLGALLARCGPLPPDQALEILSQLCHGLAAAHAAGVVHRDLKPENVFVAEPRRDGARFMVKILDFGIARLAQEARSRATAPIGTPLWMAPEQTSHGQVTAAADVWALGLLAFQMLTGRSYWRSGDADCATPRVLREIVLEPLAPASERARELGSSVPLPAGFDAWFGRAVVRELERRFADAGQARAVLDGALGAARAPLSSGSWHAVSSGSWPAHLGAPPPPQPAEPAQATGPLGWARRVLGRTPRAEARASTPVAVAPAARPEPPPSSAAATAPMTGSAGTEPAPPPARGSGAGLNRGPTPVRARRWRWLTRRRVLYLNLGALAVVLALWAVALWPRGGGWADELVDFERLPATSRSLRLASPGWAAEDGGRALAAAEAASLLAAVACGGKDVVTLLASVKGAGLGAVEQSGVLGLGTNERWRAGLRCGLALQQHFASSPSLSVAFGSADRPDRVLLLRSKQAPPLGGLGFAARRQHGIDGFCLPTRGAECDEASPAALGADDTWAFGPLGAIERLAPSFAGDRSDPAGDAGVLHALIAPLGRADIALGALGPEPVPWALACERLGPPERRKELVEACFPPGRSRSLAAWNGKLRAWAVGYDVLARGGSAGASYALRAPDADAAAEFARDLDDLVHDWRAHLERHGPRLRALASAGQSHADRARAAAVDALGRAVGRATIDRDGSLVVLAAREPLRDDEARLVRAWGELAEREQQASAAVVRAMADAAPLSEEALGVFLGADLAAWIAAPRASESDCQAYAKRQAELAPAELTPELFGPKFRLEKRFSDPGCVGLVLPAATRACLRDAATLAEMDGCRFPVSPFVTHAVARLTGSWKEVGEVKGALRGARLEITPDQVVLSVAGRKHEASPEIASESVARATLSLRDTGPPRTDVVYVDGFFPVRSVVEPAPSTSRVTVAFGEGGTITVTPLRGGTVTFRRAGPKKGTAP